MESRNHHRSNAARAAPDDFQVPQFLLARAREYRRIAASATTAEIRDALNVLAVRFAMLAAHRTDARDDAIC
jgi:hypothetical protein